MAKPGTENARKCILDAALERALAQYAKASSKTSKRARVKAPRKAPVKIAEKLKASSIEHFFHHYYAHLATDEVEAMGADVLAALALHHLKTARLRRPGKAAIVVRNLDKSDDARRVGHTIVEIVTDDVPFLVDSVTAAINTLGIAVHLAIHPILRVRRPARGQLTDVLEQGLLGADKDTIAESFIHLQIDEQPKIRHAEIEKALRATLEDVRLSVGGWRDMRDALAQLIDELETMTAERSLEDVSEARDFLRWLHDDNFTFLGYREYAFNGDRKKPHVSVVKDSGLGILSDPDRILFKEFRELADMPPEVRSFINHSDLLMITKTDTKSRVHRPAQMDFISIKRLDGKGRVVGQRAFVGLFTAGAYNKSARQIPLLRRKIQTTFDRAGLPLSNHDGKALLNILETFPRDELFQISTDQLLETSLGILRLQDRQRVALFLRRDEFQRFYSCLIYVPRDRYTTDLRHKYQNFLEEALGGVVTSHDTQLGAQPLARLHVVVHTPTGQIPKFDRATIEVKLTELAQSWSDRLGGALISAYGEMEGIRLLDSYRNAFGLGYEDRYGPEETLSDIKKIELTYVFGRLGLHLYQLNAEDGPPLRFKIYNLRQPVALSDVLPVLEDFGLRVMDEVPYRVQPDGAPCKIIIHDFGLEPRRPIMGRTEDLRTRFHEAFDHIWDGAMESDTLNALIFAAGLNWREVSVLRAYTKYLRQAGITFSEDYMARTLVENASVARGIVLLFEARFVSVSKQNTAKAARSVAKGPEHVDHNYVELKETLYSMLEDVSSADQDLILRRYINLVDVTLRTNFHQRDDDGAPRPWLSFKFSSHDIEGLPLPRPKYEVFVYAPDVEGVHLRFGHVARGGLRWSDRREDFRTEILGLVKAQQIKNAVIVPVGSKGGFVVKRALGPAATREEVLAQGIACYKMFIRGLLDLTDNLDTKGKVLPPSDVERYDGDDPYLVVAADKGTATFSDIANSVSAQYGFWLGDAFASGGSQGYDHKKMAITARGAWESVKRHFREMGQDTQSQDFTVAGVGDMSGDVFGNGMLLSPHIRLAAAFNHMHIFIDPDPSAAEGLKERQRLFAMPRSGWGDYDVKKISTGGGVFERRAKHVELSKEIRALFGVSVKKVTPNELIQMILTLDVDLLWFGGIGTYIKASSESHLDAGDRSSDAVRVDGKSVRARVIAEGANLGLTQRGRIEYALGGGRLNTDSIDNSAGVDCSDHEVNIKILLDALVAHKKLTTRTRNSLLSRMTDEVAELVLWDNYAQTQAISVIDTRGTDLADHQMRLMRLLEKNGQLDRDVEFLPSDEQLNERVISGQGLTRPEIAVLMSYSKIWLYDELLDSDLPDDAFLNDDLMRYFPTPLHKKYEDGIFQHRLRREIVATRVTNSMINRVGGTFITQIMEKTGMKPSEIARAFIVAREVFDLRPLWAQISTLDNVVPAHVQTAMLLDINRLLDRGTIWFLRNIPTPLKLTQSVKRFKEQIAMLRVSLEDALPPQYLSDLQTHAQVRIAEGVPEDLARIVTGLVNLAPGPGIALLAEHHKLDICQIAKLYYAVGSRFRLGRLRGSCEALETQSHWQKLAIAAMIEELFDHQARLTSQALAASGGVADPTLAMPAWTAAHQNALDRTDQLLTELWAGDVNDLSMIAVASRALKSLAEESPQGV